jgi:sec-independent protein translocase protein TatA
MTGHEMIMAWTLGPQELLIIFLIILLLFGAKKLPELARSLGKSTAEFKKGMKELEKLDEEPDKTEEDKEKGS